VRWRPGWPQCEGWAQNALIRSASREAVASDHQGRDAVARVAEVHPQEVALLRAVPEGVCSHRVEPAADTDGKAAFGARFFVASLRHFSLPVLPSVESVALPQESTPATFTGELGHFDSQVPAVLMMLPKELNAAELDDFFLGLVENGAANGEMQADEAVLQYLAPAETYLEAESSIGGWTSDGDEDVEKEALVNATPTPVVHTSAVSGGSLVVTGRRPPLRFRPGVPRLRLPPPGVGTVGGIDEAMKPSGAVAVGAAAPRAQGVAAVEEVLVSNVVAAHGQPLGQLGVVGSLAPLGAVQRPAWLSRSRSEVSLHRTVQEQ